ncbi:MAG TPA: peptidylprolyl isomerase [Xenococcaceae cyanobacterium]
MTALLQIGNQTLTAKEVITKLSSYQLFPKFLREIVIDEAIAAFACTPEEEIALCKNFYAGCSEAENQAWLDKNGITKEYVAAFLKRKAQLEKFKEAKWGKVVESYFFKERKHQLDQVVYSIICHQDYYLIQELYFRLINKEQCFAELAAQYSQSSEAITKGVVGPIELGKLPTKISNILTSYPAKEILATQLDRYYALLQLELFIPAKFDQSMRQLMMEELFEQWLQNEVLNLEFKTGIIESPGEPKVLCK